MTLAAWDVAPRQNTAMAAMEIMFQVRDEDLGVF